MWVRAPEKASKFQKWARDMLGNADVSKPRVTRIKKNSSRAGKRRKRRNRRKKED